MARSRARVDHFFCLFFSFPLLLWGQEGQQTEDRKDPIFPPDPIEYTSYFGIAEEYRVVRTAQGFGDYRGPRFQLQYSFHNDEVLTLETAVHQVHFPRLPKTTSLTDSSIRYLYIPYRSSDFRDFFSSVGISLQVVAPTGNFKRLTSSGNWQITPQITFSLNPLSCLSLYPSVQWTFGIAGRGRIGTHRGAALSGPRAALIVALSTPDDRYWFSTSIAYQQLQGPGAPRTFRSTQAGINAGIVPRKDLAVGIDYLHECRKQLGLVDRYRFFVAIYF